VDNETQPPRADEPRLDASAARDPVAATGSAPALLPPASLEATDAHWDSSSTRLRVLGESSTNPAVCPFLRATADGGLGPPIEAPDPRNRCTAIGQPAPQSGRQQELVCLTRSHSNCPRYLRGAVDLGEPAAAAVVRRRSSMSVLGAAVILTVAAVLLVGFLFIRGGFGLAVGSPAASQLAVVAVAPGPTTISLAPSPTPVSTPSPSPSQPPIPSPSPVVSPTPTVAPVVTPKPTAAPTSNRYAFLKACKTTPNCWVYTVRSGDNLRSIVNWFGVPYDTVLRMNPQISDPTLIRAGDQIRMPPPTR
jgi:LysM repeat protein